MVTKKQLEKDLAAKTEELEAEKQQRAADQMTHEDKVKELKAAAAASRRQTKAAVTDAKATGAKEGAAQAGAFALVAQKALAKDRGDLQTRLEAATRRADAAEAQAAAAASDPAAGDALAAAQAALASARDELASAQQSSSAEIAALTSELEQARKSGDDVDPAAFAALTSELEAERAARQALEDEAASLRSMPRADEGETAEQTTKLEAALKREAARAERATLTVDAERRKTEAVVRRINEAATRRRSEDQRERHQYAARARACARAKHALAAREAGNAQHAADAVSAAGGLAAQLASLGAGLARAGELDVAERLYREAAQLRGKIYGGRHAEEAQSLRQLAAHCRENGNLERALTYMDRSCTAYTTSLRAGEGADAVDSTRLPLRAEGADVVDSARLPPLDAAARHAPSPLREPATRLPPLHAVSRYASLPQHEPETPPAPIAFPEDSDIW